MQQYCFEHTMQVRDYECDMQGIVNNAVYQNYLEHVRHQFLISLGTSFPKIHDEKGVDPVVSRIEIDYKTSLRSGDEFVCRLAVRREGIRYVFLQDICRLPDEALCVRARVEIASLRNGRLTRGDEMSYLFDPLLC